METNNEALRNLLRAGPSALARSMSDPAVLRTMRDPDSAPPAAFLYAHPPEPSFDIFDEGDEILIVGHLPGVAAEQLRIYGYIAQVVIHVRGRGSRYSMRLPLRIDPASLSYDFHNGILTVRARPSPSSAAD